MLSTAGLGAVNDSNNISRWVGGVSRAVTRINFWHYTEVIVRTCSVSHPSPSYIYDSIQCWTQWMFRSKRILWLIVSLLPENRKFNFRIRVGVATLGQWKNILLTDVLK